MEGKQYTPYTFNYQAYNFLKPLFKAEALRFKVKESVVKGLEYFWYSNSSKEAPTKMMMINMSCMWIKLWEAIIIDNHDWNFELVYIETVNWEIPDHEKLKWIGFEFFRKIIKIVKKRKGKKVFFIYLKTAKGFYDKVLLRLKENNEIKTFEEKAENMINIEL